MLLVIKFVHSEMLQTVWTPADKRMILPYRAITGTVEILLPEPVTVTVPVR